MGYGVEEANLELQKIISGENPATEEELRRIISELDVTDTQASAGAKTILYSSIDRTVIADLAQDSSNRMLNNTAAYDFLNTIQNNANFRDSWEKVFGEVPEWTDDYSSKADKFIGGIDGDPRIPGAWDTISKNFAKTGSGEVLFLVGENANIERVFFQTEWETIKETGNYSKINGVNTNIYLNAQNINNKEVFAAMMLDTKARTLVGGDITTVSNAQMAEQVKSADFQDFIKQSDFVKENLSSPSDIKYTSKFFKSLGVFGAAAGFSIAAYQASKLSSQCNQEGADMVMVEYCSKLRSQTWARDIAVVCESIYFKLVA